MCRFLFGDTGHSEMYLNGAFGECLTSHLNKQLRTVSFILLKNCSLFFFFFKGAESTSEGGFENHKCSTSKGFSADDVHVIPSDSSNNEVKELEIER